MTGQQKLWSPQRFIWSLPQQDGRLFSGLKLVVTTILVVAISLLNSRYVTKTPGTGLKFISKRFCTECSFLT